MPANDGSNITIAGPRGGLTTTDPFQQASKLFSAMRRASGGGGDSSVAAALGLPPNAKIDYMLDPRTGAYVPVVGGTDELRKHNLEAAKQRRALQAFETKDEKSPAGIIKSKLEGFAGKSAEKQASILNDIRTNDIPKLSQASGVSGSDLITYGLADYTRMQGENAANVGRVGVGDILWDSARIGVRNFMDSVADIFSDSQEQLARADARQKYIRDIQDSNAFLRNRALQQQEGASFMDRFGIGELAATTGEFLAENAPVLAATALTGGAAGLAARGLGAAAATAGRASMLGSAVGGGLTGMPTQLGSAINEIAGSNMTEDQKLQALDEAYGPSLRAGAALGAVVMPFGQYISRGIGSGLARAGVGNSNVAKMVRSRRANEALPTGVNNWDEAMAMARRNDILAENEAIANQGFISGMIGRRLRDSAIEGSLLSGASQMATNAAVGNGLMENVGPATIGGAIGGALFTPFNRRTAMGVPEDVIGPRTTERQKLAQLLTNINAERAGDTVSREDQILNAMDAWNTAAGFRGDALFDSSRPMTPEQYDAYVRQQQHDDLLLNRMMAHEQAMQERANNFGFNDIVADPFRGYGAPVQFGDRTATAGPRIIDRTPPPLGRYDALASEWNRVAAERAAQLQAVRDAALDAEFAPRSIFDVMPEPVPYTPPSRITRSVFSPDERLAQEWDTLERARAAANLARQARTYPVPYTPMGVSAVEAEPTPEFVRAQVERQYGTMTGYPYSTGSLMESSPVGELPPAGPRALAEDPSRNRWEGGSIPTGSYGIFVPQDAALPLGTDRATAGDFWVGPSLMDIPAAQSIATERARRYPATEGEFRLGDITADNPWISQAIRDSQVITTPDLRSPEEIAFTNDWFATAAQNQVNARTAGEAARQRRLPAPYTSRGVVPVADEPTPEFVRAQVERQYGTMAGYPYSAGSLMESRPTGELPPAGPRALAEDPSRNRWEGGAIPQGESPTAINERAQQLAEQRQQLVDVMSARGRQLNEQERHDFVVYEGEVLLENNPGVLPTNNYLPENVAAVVEHLGEPRTAETMLDGTPATDKRPQPQRPYTKAITYVSSDEALNKFTGKLRGRESMIPRDVREEQMGWMNDILAAGTGKGRISAQGVLAKDVQSTLDNIVDSQTVDGALRLDELLLTRLRGSEGTSLFNRAQRAAMQYVRNRIYTTMDDYAYRNKLGRYGETNANNPENPDPTSGGGSPTSGMGGADTAGTEPLADANLSDDSGGQGNTAGASEATAGQLPDGTPANGAAVKERGNAGAKASGAGENQTVEGNPAAEAAAEQTANGERGAGNAATVSPAADQGAGGDRLEGSPRKSDGRDAADTGSNEQSRRGTEPEDGEPIDPSIEEDPSMYKVHTLDWPYRNLDEELAARDAENVKISTNKKTKKKTITIDPLIGDDTGGRLKVSDDLRVETEVSADYPVYPTIIVTLQNARGKELTAAYHFATDDGAKRGAWIPTDTIPNMSEDTVLKEIPGITIQGSTGKIQIDARKLPSMAKDFEGRVHVELFDDTMQPKNEVEFPFQPHDFDSSPTAETPREVLNGMYKGGHTWDSLVNTTPTLHFPVEDSLGEPVSTAATYVIDDSIPKENARVILTIGDSRYPNVTYARVVADANRTVRNSKQINRETSEEYHTSEDTQDIDDDLPDFMETSFGGKNIDISLTGMPASMQETIERRGRFTVTGRIIDADGNDIVKPESATYFVYRDEDDAIQHAEKLGYYNKPNETPTVEQAPVVEPKGLSSAEEIAKRQANPDVVPTEGVDPENNEALAWAAQQQENRTHVEDDDPNSTNTSSKYGSEYRNLTGNNKQYKALNIRSSTSKTQISVDTTEPVAAERVKVFPGYIRIMLESPDTNRNSDEISIAFRIKSDKLPETSYTYAGIYNKENGDSNTNWRFEPAPMQEEFWYYMRNGHVYGESRGYTINKQVIDGANYKFKGYAITNNLDKNRISTPEDTPKIHNEYAYIHLDNMEELLKLIPNDDTASFNIKIYPYRDNTENKFNFSGTLAHNELLNPATRNTASNSLLDAANIKPTKQNIEAAQRVVKEGGSIDTHEAFSEDAAPANATITAKDSLKANTKKKIQKAAAQNLPQLPIEEAAPTTDSPAVFSERFSRTIDDMEKQYTRNNNPIDGFVKGAASSAASAKRIIAKRNASDASWKEDLRNDMAETAARIGIMRSTGLFGEIKRGSPLAKKEEFYKNNNIPLIAPNSDMARHLREYFGAMPARERKITQAIDYVLRDPTAQKFDIIDNSTQGAC